MINKKLLSFDRGALRYVGANVAFQWLGMLCNVIFVRAIAQLVGAAFAGSLTSAQLWQNLVLCLATVPMRFAFTMLASAMSDQASKDVKRTLRSKIYEKLTRLGPGYTATVATSEVVMLASEGVEQIDTYFAKYLPQLFYSLLAPVTLFVLLVGVHARSAIILLCCVPLIPMSIVAVQKFAKKLLANYWGEYTTLGDSFLENIQGLTTLKIYQADGWKHEQMNAQAERFRRITMKVLTMQLNSVTLMDLMAYGGAGFGIISAVAAFAAGRLTLTATLTIVLLAADFFLPLRLLGSYFHIAMNGAASAEKIFKLLAAEEPADGDRVPGENTTLKLEHVTFGYEKDRTILNDVSARDVQTAHKQWYFGKSLDGFTPIGPCIVTADEFDTYPPKLPIRCFVNGEKRQDSNTGLQIFDIDHVIAELSQGMTLKAGTIIATGTPAGVGMGMEPPCFLKPGDEVRCEIEGIGTLTNTVR